MSPAEAARQLKIEVNQMALQISHNARSRAFSGVNILRNAELQVLGQNGSGRTYKRHIASAPGQPPAPDKGNLRQNWRRAVLAAPNGKGVAGVTIKMRITSDMFYQPFLEKGTRKMAPRPHMQKIKEKARPQIAALFANL